jgi:hypothetical protein
MPATDTIDDSRLLADYLTEEELARELRVSPRTLLNWRQQRRGPPWTSVGRKVIYRKASSAKWLEANEHSLGRRK